jgi:hypothetical protein
VGSRDPPLRPKCAAGRPREDAPIPAFVGDVAAVTKKIAADPARPLPFKTVRLGQPRH